MRVTPVHGASEAPCPGFPRSPVGRPVGLLIGVCSRAHCVHKVDKCADQAVLRLVAARAATSRFTVGRYFLLPGMTLSARNPGKTSRWASLSLFPFHCPASVIPALNYHFLLKTPVKPVGSGTSRQPPVSLSGKKVAHSHDTFSERKPPNCKRGQKTLA